MDTALQSDSVSSSSTKWSLFEGFYAFVCATMVAALLSDILGVLADVISLSSAYWMVVLASPALVIGTGAWWLLVERRRSHAYRRGGAFGLVTALLTALLWTISFVIVWGVEMLAVPMVAVLVVWVVGLAAVAGVLVGLPLMYARRYLSSDSSVGTEYPT